MRKTYNLKDIQNNLDEFKNNDCNKGYLLSTLKELRG